MMLAFFFRHELAMLAFYFRRGPVWWFWIPPLFALLFWVAIILLVAGLIRRHHGHGHEHHWHEHGSGYAQGSGALRILEERYARGEINRDEFLERRSVLVGGARAGPPAAGSSHDEGTPPDIPPPPAQT